MTAKTIFMRAYMYAHMFVMEAYSSVCVHECVCMWVCVHVWVCVCMCMHMFISAKDNKKTCC